MLEVVAVEIPETFHQWGLIQLQIRAYLKDAAAGTLVDVVEFPASAGSFSFDAGAKPVPGVPERTAAVEQWRKQVAECLDEGPQQTGTDERMDTWEQRHAWSDLPSLASLLEKT